MTTPQTQRKSYLRGFDAGKREAYAEAIRVCRAERQPWDTNDWEAATIRCALNIESLAAALDTPQEPK